MKIVAGVHVLMVKCVPYGCIKGNSHLNVLRSLNAISLAFGEREEARMTKRVKYLSFRVTGIKKRLKSFSGKERVHLHSINVVRTRL